MDMMDHNHTSGMMVSLSLFELATSYCIRSNNTDDISLQSQYTHGSAVLLLDY